MHELGLTESIVAIVSERAGTSRVTRVFLEIGRLTAVMPEAIRFCFELCSAGTNAEGATLEIIEVPGRGRCRACRREAEISNWLWRCDCGSSDIECIAGEELTVKAMEIL